MLNNIITPLAGSPLQPAMQLAIDSFNHLQAAGGGFLQTRKLIQDSKANQLLELSIMIDLIHQLSLMLRDSTKGAYGNILDLLSSMWQTIIDKTNKTQHRRNKAVERKNILFGERKTKIGRKNKPRRPEQNNWSQK